MTLPLSEERVIGIRKTWESNTDLTYADVAERHGCSVRQVRSAVKDLPREGWRVFATARGVASAQAKKMLGATTCPAGALRVLQEIRDFRAAHQFAPSTRELCTLLGFSSLNGMNDHLRVLEKYRLITRMRFQARTIVITPAGVAALEAMP